VTGKTVSAQAQFVPQPQPYLELTSAEVAARLGQVIVLDARSPGEDSGARKVGLVARAGTLPGAKNLPDTAPCDRTIAKPDANRALMAQAGITGDPPIVTFCNFGRWGALDWFAMSEVKDVALYPGSMSVWTADTARPVQ
jgi:thiosulfate/3-mercaptopyruvate sulfurtransferase